MSHEELLKRIESKFIVNDDGATQAGSTEFALRNALRAVVELHKPMSDRMPDCAECVTIHQGETDVVNYPCPTIQAIEKELK